MSLSIPECVKDWIKKSLDKTGKFSHNKSIKLASDEVNKWMESCELSERQVAWLVIRELDEIPKCRTCGKPLSNFERKGATHCSQKCAKNDPLTTERLKETNLKKYGTEYACQAKEVKDKIKASLIEEYGVDNPAKADAVKRKMKETMLKRHGVEYALQSEKSRQKYRETCKERFGADSPMQNADVQQKARETTLERYGCSNPQMSDAVRRKTEETNLKRYGSINPLLNAEVKQKAKETLNRNYGVSSPLQSKEILQKVQNTTLNHYGVHVSLLSEEVQEKSRQTNLERYGNEIPIRSDEVKSRIKNTCIDRYGVDCALNAPEAKQKSRISIRSKTYEQNESRLNQKGLLILSSREEAIRNEVVKYRCRRCGVEFTTPSLCYQSVHCPSCLKKTVSAKEKQVLDFVKEVYSGEVIENCRTVIKPYEFDIYIPSLHLAVEFNGTYWHSAELKPKNYHLEKTLACAERGVRLIHVFEWEWDQNEALIKSLLLKALGVHQKTIYARQCTVTPISQSDYRAFLSLHHLQGPVNSSIRLGLIYENEPVMVAGWGRSRFNSKEMELHRLCTKEGLNVAGGFSKLIAHCGLNQFISYVDRAHFTGDGYRKCGFIETGFTSPGYRWVNEDGISISRQMAQKSRLPKLLGEEYDPEMTEVENMVANGWHQVFDCGNLKMEWTKK